LIPRGTTNKYLTVDKSDFINGLIYITLTVFIWVSIRRVLLDKEVKGVSWMTLGGLASRSCWNLYFYTHMTLWYSLVGVTTLAFSEVTYCILLYKYSHDFRKQIHEQVVEPVKDVVEAVIDKIIPEKETPPPEQILHESVEIERMIGEGCPHTD